MALKRMLAVVSVVALPLAVVACGDDDEFDLGDLGSGAESGDESGGGEEFADAMDDVTGASAGGGTLVFDGTEYPIESALCVLDGDRVDIGTLGANYRVLVSGDPASPSLQILDPEGIQWFDGDPTDVSSGSKATIDGTTVTGEENTWWNNADDRVITASFVIECP